MPGSIPAHNSGSILKLKIQNIGSQMGHIDKKYLRKIVILDFEKPLRIYSFYLPVM